MTPYPCWHWKPSSHPAAPGAGVGWGGDVSPSAGTRAKGHTPGLWQAPKLSSHHLWPHSVPRAWPMARADHGHGPRPETWDSVLQTSARIPAIDGDLQAGDEGKKSHGVGDPGGTEHRAPGVSL